MEAPIKYWWLIKKTSYKDYIFWGNTDSSTKFEIRNGNKLEPIEYNQKLIWNYCCTIMAAIWCISDLTRYNYKRNELKEIWRKAIDLWADPYQGWYFYKAVDLVRKEWNDINNDKLSTYRIKLLWEDLMSILNSWHSVMCWYNGNSNYNKDKNDDWVLGWTKFWRTTYSHAVRIRKKFSTKLSQGVNNLFTIQVIDNYTGLVKFNIYTLKYFKELIQNWVFFEYWYLFFNQKHNMIFKDVDEGQPFAKAIKKAKHKWIVKWFQDWSFKPNDWLTRGQFMWILDRLGLLDD